LPHDAGVRWVPAENLHVTLRFLGDTDGDEVRARLADVTLPAATALVGPRVSRLGSEAVVVPVEGLAELAAVVSEATVDVGRRPERRAFRAHVTIGRLYRGGRCHLVGRPIEAVFPVRDVALVQSVLHPSGARYETIATWAVSAG
jgi:RNA 2',3'-cyclic 3'-phosphodiesterase